MSLFHGILDPQLSPHAVASCFFVHMRWRSVTATLCKRKFRLLSRRRACFGPRGVPCTTVLAGGLLADS